MPPSDYKGVKGGSLKLKGNKKNLFKADKTKKSKSEKKNAVTVNPDTVSHGGWRKLENEVDLKGGMNISIEVDSASSARCYLAALDNGKFTIGAPHEDGEGPNPEEIFALVKTSDDAKVSFKTGYGKFIGVDTEFTLVAFAEAIGVREQFQFIFQDGKVALQAVSSPLFLSTVANKEGFVHVASRKATEDEMIVIRTDAEEVGPVDWRSEEDKKNARECELAYVKMFQHSKVDLKNRHISVDLKDRKSVKRAQAEGSAHELLLERRVKTKSDRYC